MSIFNSFRFALKPLFETTPERLKYTCGVVGGAVALHALYAYTTVDEKVITVKEKYQTYSNDHMKYHIVDTNNKHYCIGYSLWYFQYDVPEKWTSIEHNKTYNIKHYGYRVPFLGLFPNIIDHF